MKGILYVVATPIGNMEDMTDRAERILREVDIVAAEDTRSVKKLFNILGIRNKVISNHKFNEKRQVEYLLSELHAGNSVAIVSDAGTPCISDPGGIIVSEAAKQGVNVVGVCGASAVITALSVCGFTSSSFAFYGFLPKEVKNIKKAIDVAKNSDVSIAVFFESPKRVRKSLEVFASEAPTAEICLCNDLSKLYERVYRGYPSEVLGELLANPSADKGEYTLVAFFGKEQEALPVMSQTPESILVDYIMQNNCSLKDAVNSASELFKGVFAKKEFYKASLNLKVMFSNQD